MDETARSGHPDEGTAGVGCKNPDYGSGVSTSTRGNMVPHTTPHQRGGAHVYARAVGDSCMGHGAGCVRGVAITILREGSDATPTRPQTQLSCSDWICPGCANHTWASGVCCKRCQQPKVSKVGPGDWMCQRCSIVYCVSRTKCNRCAAPKETAKRTPAYRETEDRPLHCPVKGHRRRRMYQERKSGAS